MFCSKASLKADKEFFMLFDIAGINATYKFSKSSLKCQLLLKCICEQAAGKTELTTDKVNWNNKMILPMGSCTIDTAKVIDVNNQTSMFAAYHIFNQLSINSISVLQIY